MFARVVDLFAVLLFCCAATAFLMGVRALTEQRELHSVYWLMVGALLLRSSVEVFRPGSGPRL